MKLNTTAPREDVPRQLETVWPRPPEARNSRAGRKPWDATLVFTVIVQCERYSLSEVEFEVPVHDRRHALVLQTAPRSAAESFHRCPCFTMSLKARQRSASETSLNAPKDPRKAAWHRPDHHAESSQRPFIDQNSIVTVFIEVPIENARQILVTRAIARAVGRKVFARIMPRRMDL